MTDVTKIEQKLLDDQITSVIEIERKLSLILIKKYGTDKRQQTRLSDDLNILFGKIAPKKETINGWIKQNKPVNIIHWSCIIKFIFGRNTSEEIINTSATCSFDEFKKMEELSKVKKHFNYTETKLLLMPNREEAIDYISSIANATVLSEIINTHIVFYKEANKHCHNYPTYEKSTIIKISDFFVDQIENGCVWNELTNLDKPIWLEHAEREKKVDSIFKKGTLFNIYRIDEIPIPVVNFIILKHRTDHREVLFGWGYMNGTVGPVYHSNYPTLVSYFSTYFECLKSKATKINYPFTQNVVTS